MYQLIDYLFPCFYSLVTAATAVINSSYPLGTIHAIHAGSIEAHLQLRLSRRLCIDRANSILRLEADHILVQAGI